MEENIKWFEVELYHNLFRVKVTEINCIIYLQGVDVFGTKYFSVDNTYYNNVLRECLLRGKEIKV